MICYGANFEARGLQMRRREFIAGLGSAAASPVVGWAQPSDVVKRVAWVGDTPEDAAIFGRELARLGWVEGRNVSVDYRLEADDRRLRAIAPDIVGAAPDLIVRLARSTRKFSSG
jgi:putative tryptophan/tyrosine transport system substrate-binding protein